MRLTYMIDSLAPGGAESSLAALAPELVAAGVALDVVCLHDRAGMRQQLVEAGASVTCLGGPPRRLSWVRGAARHLREKQPDLVHTTLFEADVVGRIAARLTHIPVVSSLVNVPYGPEHLADPRLRWWKVRGAQAVDVMTARGVRRFHAITGHVADVMAGRLRIDRASIDVIPRGRDPVALGIRTAERRLCARAMLGIAEDEFLVFAAARQAHQKGLDLLVEAFPRILEGGRRARLVLAGREGDATPTIEKRVSQLGLEVSVKQLGVRTDVPEIMCGADVFVLPSRWEGLGSVLIEAMALETPIVASDLPAVREVLADNETALLVAPERPDLLAGAMANVIGDPERNAKRVKMARARFLSRYTIAAVASQTLAFYDRALGTAQSDELAPATP